ncbi:hypothetical protein BDP27DRAFT_1429707 [Rhodocollybia butyracea]|uniref:Uncharacterized protein n=1 Tax=Rhodocollybia butyracea TaxID=206335 RepID=A0A9P5PER5_9AGAR|nr:hypothetical protein BDP27DRAFT_1429707 [Rhodocollybia butyracea]
MSSDEDMDISDNDIEIGMIPSTPFPCTPAQPVQLSKSIPFSYTLTQPTTGFTPGTYYYIPTPGIHPTHTPFISAIPISPSEATQFASQESYSRLRSLPASQSQIAGGIEAERTKVKDVNLLKVENILNAISREAWTIGEFLYFFSRAKDGITASRWLPQNGEIN